eukprot:COSAG05_NODE_3461_length_2045_cov_5.141316_2_plen_71_part_00
MKQLKLKFKGEPLEAMEKTLKDVKIEKDATVMLDIITKSGSPAPAGGGGGGGGPRGAAGPPGARGAAPAR